MSLFGITWLSLCVDDGCLEDDFSLSFPFSCVMTLRMGDDGLLTGSSGMDVTAKGPWALVDLSTALGRARSR